MELRIPPHLLANALAAKNTKALRLFAAAKLEGHRSEIKPLCGCLKIMDKTCGRLVKKIVSDGWAGTDGTFLFPRSWRKLQSSKRGGLYLNRAPKDLKKFESLCFAKALKRIYRKRESPHSNNRRVMQEDFPTTGYLCKSLGISERRFERLKASAQKYRFITVSPQRFTVVGKASEFETLRKNNKEQAVFKSGKNCLIAQPTRIKVLI